MGQIRINGNKSLRRSNGDDICTGTLQVVWTHRYRYKFIIIESNNKVLVEIMGMFSAGRWLYG